MLYIMWCLWEFCQIISIFLLGVLMILDTHYARERNVCAASLPVKYSHWHGGKGFRAQYALLRCIAIVHVLSSYLWLCSCYYCIYISTPIIGSLSFLLWNNLCSLYPSCQLCAFIVLFPLLLCCLCICTHEWEQLAGTRVHPFSISPMETTAGPSALM